MSTPSANTDPTPDPRDIDGRRLIRWLFLICVSLQLFFVLCDYLFNYQDLFGEQNIRRIWNIAREESLPTWFSSIQTQLLGVTVLAIGAAGTAARAWWKTGAWVLAGLFFVWIGVDDFASIHERLGGVLERMAGDGQSDGGWANPSFSWHTFIAPFYALCSLAIAAFTGLAFWRRGLLHYLLLGFGLWALSQGIDFIEGLDEVEELYDWLQELWGVERRYAVTHTMKVIEEMLEMFGTTLLWMGFLHFLAADLDGRTFRVRYGER